MLPIQLTSPPHYTLPRFSLLTETILILLPKLSSAFTLNVPLHLFVLYNFSFGGKLGKPLLCHAHGVDILIAFGNGAILPLGLGKTSERTVHLTEAIV